MSIQEISLSAGDLVVRFKGGVQSMAEVYFQGQWLVAITDKKSSTFEDGTVVETIGFAASPTLLSSKMGLSARSRLELPAVAIQVYFIMASGRQFWRNNYLYSQALEE